MAGIPSRVNASAREQLLSTDLNRIGNLAGRELMDAAQARSVRSDFYKPSTNTFDDFSAAGKAAQATPIAGLTQPPSLDGMAAVFDMALGAGEGQLPATPASSDVSGYQLLRWDAQTLTWPAGGTPDATNPLICLVVATPADQLTDLQSRNILLDPILRTVSPANCYKTTNPVATISVIAGAAASAPVAPAVPAGALALFEVYVPPLAADSLAFLPVRRAWRQIEFPGTSQHGIVKGCIPAEPSGGLILPVTGLNRVVIDGELLSFSGAFWIAAVADTVTPPTAAPATNDKPLYLYLVGGRNQPAMDYTTAGGGGGVVPVRFVISATPPDSAGYPTASLGVASPAMVFPRAACCYIGVAFYAANSATIAPAFFDGDWIFAASTVSGGARAFKDVLQTGVITTTPFTLATKPASSTACILTASGTVGSGLIYDGAGMLLVTSPTLSGDTPPVYLGLASMASLGSSVVAGATMRPSPVGYNMNIPRIAR